MRNAVSIGFGFEPLSLSDAGRCEENSNFLSSSTIAGTDATELVNLLLIRRVKLMLTKLVHLFVLRTCKLVSDKTCKIDAYKACIFVCLQNL